MFHLLDDVAPRRVLAHFGNICSIPHDSGHEAALGDHILALASRRGLEAQRDSAGNILVRVSASPGCEAVPPLLLQGHMDMVCVQEEGRNWDPHREGVTLVREGNILRADGTTLGADNAVGLCNMMALMEADDLPHPPLELLFTTCEEVGLVGIRRFDMTQLRARRMLNMDMGDPDCMVIGSAGSGKFRLEKHCEISDADGAAVTVSISGLRGGHSGLLAGKNHASALWLLGRVLAAAADALPVRLAALRTGGTGASIPTDAAMTLCAPDGAAICALLEGLAASLKTELTEEPNLSIAIAAAAAPPVAASAADTRALADLLLLVPCDATHRAANHPEWVLCSSLLLDAAIEEGRFSGLFALRANRDAYRMATLQCLQTLCRMTGTTLQPLDEWIPAWPEREDTPLQQLCRQVYRDCFHAPLSVEVEHGTVEVSVIAQAIPDMDIVGLAPKSRGAHTTQEHLYLDSMEPFWTFLTALLRAMCS